MTIKNNVGGVYKTIDSVKVNIGGVWKEVIKGWCNINGSWKEFYAKVTQMIFGTAVDYSSVGGYYSSIAFIDSTHFVVCYQGTSSQGKAKIGTVDGNGITFGSEYTFNANATSYIDVDLLDSTHIVVVFKPSTALGQAIVGTISGGNVLTFDSAEKKTFNDAGSTYNSVRALDSTHFVVAYRDAGATNYGNAIVGVVSAGDTITFDSLEEATFNAAATSYCSICKLDSTHFAIGYRNSNTYGVAIIGTVSADDTLTFTATDKVTFSATDSYYMSLAYLDSTHFVIAWMNGGDSNKPTALVVSFSGTTITMDAAEKKTYGSLSTEWTKIIALDSTHIVGFGDENVASNAIATSGVITAGDTITFDTANKVTWGTDDWTHVAACALTTTKFVVGCKAVGSYGKAYIGNLPS